MTPDPRCWQVDELVEHAERVAAERGMNLEPGAVWRAALSRLADSEIIVVPVQSQTVRGLDSFSGAP